MAVSTVYSRRLEDVSAAATGPLWFQLYIYEGARHFAEALVRRVRGHRASGRLPRWGRKERFARVEDGLPPGADTASIEGDLGEEALEPAALSWDLEG